MKCKYCKRLFKKEKYLRLHENGCVQKIINRKIKALNFRKKSLGCDSSSQRGRTKFIYSCNQCNFRSSRISSAITHRAKYPFCTRKRPTSEKDVNYSTITLTRENAKFKCRNCKSIFHNFRSCRNHETYCHLHGKWKSNFTRKRRIFKCNECERVFLLESSCKRHVLSHLSNAHLRGGGYLKPEAWGYTESKILINSPNFDEQQIRKVMINEITNEIKRRKKENLIKPGELISTVIVFICEFIKHVDIESDSDERILVYFHTAPIRLIRLNIREEITTAIELI